MSSPNTPWTGPVSQVNWMNWLGYQAVISDEAETLIAAGVITDMSLAPMGGTYTFTLGGNRQLTYGASDVIMLATPAQASQYVYGRALSPQTP